MTRCARLAITLAMLGLLVACAQPRMPKPPSRPAPSVGPAGPAVRVASFAELPGWSEERHAEALVVFLKGCAAIRPDKPLAPACAAARGVPAGDDGAARAFFEARFEPVELSNGDGSTRGLITGYYEPVIQACRARRPGCSAPIHGVPDDLIAVELASIDPDLKGKRLRGRLEGRKLVPYASRAEIDARSATAAGDGKPLPAAVLAWAVDPVDVFFLQVQGSGRLQMEDGSVVRVGYADQNGHPYRAVGKSLVERGALAREAVSMQSIRDWLAANLAERDAVLATNPSYVFFRELPPSEEPPPGSLGVALTPARSIAVDINVVPLGSPVWLVTTDPEDGSPIRRLMAAQDTGGAIRGGVRADLFWGRGESAAAKAGRMQQTGRMWLLRVRV
jgi:membrane-bound lytic murein transglycosylase A